MRKIDYLVYDSYDCFADIGGQVGILLGLSFVAAFDNVVSTAWRMTRFFRQESNTEILNT